MIARAALLLVAVILLGCPSPRHPTQPAGAVTLEIGRDGASLRGVAGDGAQSYVALSIGDTTKIEARRGSAHVWESSTNGQAGPLAVNGPLVAVAIGGTKLLGQTMRGEPGAMVWAVDSTRGAPKWHRMIDASEYVVIAAIAAHGTGFVVVGSFGGSLRVADKVVSSGGKSDGFIVRLDDKGDVTWLHRMGGVGADAVLGVATAKDRIAIAGTFAAGADIQGTLLEPYDAKTPRADGFVAELDGNGQRKWSASFGGKLDDSVVGVAIDGTGRVAVAASAREVMRIGPTEVIARGDADGVLAWWTKDGVPGAVVQLGGADFDGVRAIATVGNRVVVGGFFSGTMRFGQQKLVAAGGDDAYVAAFENGALHRVWTVTGEGREEIAALAFVPGGFVAGITHTAKAEVDGAPLPAPKDPLGGAALVIRPL